MDKNVPDCEENWSVGDQGAGRQYTDNGLERSGLFMIMAEFLV